LENETLRILSSHETVLMQLGNEFRDLRCSVVRDRQDQWKYITDQIKNIHGLLDDFTNEITELKKTIKEISDVDD